MKCDYTMILGDFNFPTIDWENWSTPHSVMHREFKFIECLRDNFLSQLIDCPTRFRDGQASNILDLIILDKPEIVQDVNYCSNLGASDHISIMIELSCSPECNKFDLVKRNYHKGNYGMIHSDLSLIDWKQIVSLSVDEGYIFIVGEINKVVEKHIPLKNTNKTFRKKK